MAINNFSLLQPNQPLTATDKLLADINNFNNTVVPNLPPPPPVNVPKYTKFGDNLATLGGFGDQPNELLAQEQLAKMTQDQVDAYNQQRKKARTQGIGELLMRFGDALQGKNASQLAYGRQQVRDLGDAKAAYQQAINIAEASGDFRKANLLRSLGLPGFQELQQKRLLAQLDPKDRRIVEGADGRKYYADNMQLVLPDLVVPEDNLERNKMILSERKEVGKFYKPVNDAVVGYRKLEDALMQKSGTAAYTALVLFMKNLDGSVVKEGEIAAFGKAQGLLGNIEKQIKETKGEGMTDEMRADIYNLAKASTKHMVDGYDSYLAGTKLAYDGINLPSDSIFSGFLIDREGLDFTPATADFFLPRIELK